MGCSLLDEQPHSESRADQPTSHVPGRGSANSVVVGPTPVTARLLSTGNPRTGIVGAAPSGKNSAALPNYIAPNLAAKPDYDAHDPRVTLAWDNYPKNPADVVDQTRPGQQAAR